MRLMWRVAAVAGLLLAVGGCGADRSDVEGGAPPTGGWQPAPAAEADAADLEVLGLSGVADGEAPVDHGEDAAEPVHDESADESADDVTTATAGESAHATADHAIADDATVDHANEDRADETGPAHGDHGDRDDADGDHGDETHHATDATGATGATDAADEPADDAAAHDGEHVVEVTMVEFGYVLDRPTVPVGEPVTFRFVNDGQIEHEAMFGTMHQQEEFAASDDHGDHGDHGSQGHHGEVAAITLDAAASGEMVLVFDSPGVVLIGCHLPGHWEAGMVASLEVVAA